MRKIKVERQGAAYKKVSAGGRGVWLMTSMEGMACDFLSRACAAWRFAWSCARRSYSASSAATSREMSRIWLLVLSFGALLSTILSKSSMSCWRRVIWFDLLYRILTLKTRTNQGRVSQRCQAGIIQSGRITVAKPFLDRRVLILPTRLLMQVKLPQTRKVEHPKPQRSRPPTPLCLGN